MGEIPADIIDIAETAWAALEDADGIRECVLTIAVALMAERERCAKIIETQRVYEIGDRYLLAAAIRGGN